MKWVTSITRSRWIRGASMVSVSLLLLAVVPMWVTAYAETEAQDAAQRREALGKRLIEVEEMTTKLKITAETNVQAAVDGRKRCLNSVKFGADFVRMLLRSLNVCRLGCNYSLLIGDLGQHCDHSGRCCARV